MLMLQSIFNLDSFPLFFSFPFMAAVGTVGLVWLGGKYLYHSHSCPATRIPSLTGKMLLLKQSV